MSDGQAALKRALTMLNEATGNQLAAFSPQQLENAQEIRLMAGCRAQLVISNRVLTACGARVIEKSELSKCLLALCGHALHSHQRELAGGYLTLDGGHRAGFAATAVYNADGVICGIREVNAIVLRIAKDHRGAADRLIAEAFGSGICGLLIAGAPFSGKTTMLRDIAAAIAGGRVSGCDRAAVVDERGELSAGCRGCCVLTGYDKGDGILAAVRSLSPQAVICDEIGGESDLAAVKYALNCGVAVITSIHAADRAELLARRAGRELLSSGAFKKVVILSAKPHPCTITEVFSTDEGDYKADGAHSCFRGLYTGRDSPRQTLPAAGVRA